MVRSQAPPRVYRGQGQDHPVEKRGEHFAETLLTSLSGCAALVRCIEGGSVVWHWGEIMFLVASVQA